MVGIAINSATASGLYLDLIKAITFSGTRRDKEIELQHVLTCSYGKNKYVTNGPIHVVNTLNSLFSFLEKDSTFLRNFVETSETTYTTSFGYVVVQNQTVNLTVHNSSVNVLDYGNILLFYGTLLELLASLKNFDTGSIVVFNNKITLEKVYNNYYNEIECDTGTYCLHNPLEVVSLEELFRNITTLRNLSVNSEFRVRAWNDVNLLNIFMTHYNNKYYTEAKKCIDFMTPSSFEKLWATKVVSNGAG